MRPITPIPCMLRSALRTDFMAGVVINRSRGNKIKIIAKGNNRGRKRRVNMNIVGPLSMCLVIKVLKQKKETNGSKGSNSRPNPTGQTDPGDVGKKHRKQGQVLKPGMASKHTSIQHALTELARTVQSAKRKAARLCTQYYIIRAAGYAAKRNGKTRSRV